MADDQVVYASINESRRNDKFRELISDKIRKYFVDDYEDYYKNHQWKFETIEELLTSEDDVEIYHIYMYTEPPYYKLSQVELD